MNNAQCTCLRDFEALCNYSGGQLRVRFAFPTLSQFFHSRNDVTCTKCVVSRFL